MLELITSLGFSIKAVSMIREEMTWVLLLLATSNLDHIIYEIAQKANKVLGTIKHTFKYLEPNIIMMHVLHKTPIF